MDALDAYPPPPWHLRGEAAIVVVSGGPAVAGLDVPARSPFAGLGIGGRHLAVDGSRLALEFGAAQAIATM